jgi:RNA polymerase sigma-70 factor (ECF subfamily)
VLSRTQGGVSDKLEAMTAAELTDEDLMLRYRADDAGAFEELYRRHRSGLYRYLLRQVSQAALAEELYQDIWLNVVRARKRYTVQSRFATYLYRIAHNRVIDHYRGRRQVITLSFEQDESVDADCLTDDPACGPEEIVCIAQQAERLMGLIERLPVPQREAFLMHEEGGLNVDEIAQATGVNRETAKSRLRYAYAKLKQGLRDDP